MSHESEGRGNFGQREKIDVVRNLDRSSTDSRIAATTFIHDAVERVSTRSVSETVWDHLVPTSDDIFKRQPTLPHTGGFLHISEELVQPNKQPIESVISERFEVVFDYLSTEFFRRITTDISERERRYPRREQSVTIWKVEQSILDKWFKEEPPFTPRSPGYTDRVRKLEEGASVDASPHSQVIRALDDQVQSIEEGMAVFLENHHLLPLVPSINRLVDVSFQETSSVRERELATVEVDNALSIIREYITSSETENWLRTFSQDDILIDRATLLLRLSQGKTVEEFAQSSDGLSAGNIRKWEERVSPPALYQSDKLLVATSIDPLSRPGQRYHLIRNDVMPVSTDEFISYSSIDQFNYIHDLTGLSITVLAERMGYDRGSIARLKAAANISERAIVEILKIFNIPTTSAIYNDVMIQRLGNDTAPIEITAKARQEILNGPLLFQEHVQRAKSTFVYSSHEEEEFSASVLELDSINEIFRKVRNVGLRKVANMGGGSVANIKEIESTDQVPNELTVFQFMQALGYEFHHPVMQHALKIVWKLKMEQQERHRSNS